MQKVAALQWQFDDPLVLNHSPGGGALGIEQRRPAGNLDRLRHRAHAEIEVDAGHLLNLQLDAAAGRALEARMRHPYFVHSRIQRGETVHPLRVRQYAARQSRFNVLDREFRTCHYRAGRVADDSGDFALRLSEGQSKRKGAQHANSADDHTHPPVAPDLHGVIAPVTCVGPELCFDYLTQSSPGSRLLKQPRREIVQTAAPR